MIHSFTIVKVLRNSIPNLMKKYDNMPLGRWGRTHEDIKTFYANMDHCGDKICGNPQEIKKAFPRTNKKN